MVRRPNILLIVSDDHGHADRSALGHHSDVRTPALDRIAAEGVTCTDAYVTAPICSPSRSGMISGRYQQRWGGLWFGSSQFPPDDNPTVAETLRDQGYRTGYFGKVHYGTEDVGDRACPPHHGFESTLYGLAGQSQGRLNYLHHSERSQQEYGPEASFRMAVQPLLSGDEPYEYEGFLTEELGRAAGEFIAEPEDGDDRPFFCMLAFNAVHNFCWQLPAEELERRGLPAFHDWQGETADEYTEWYDDVIVPNLPHGRDYYLAQLELMDAQIQMLLELLDRTGQAEDTIVVYTTDNGGSTCNYGDNTPYRGTKYTLWEGGIRVPMLWRWPGVVEAGSSTDEPVSTLDLHATLAGAAGAERPDGLDGQDLAQVFTGGPGQSRSLHWECGFQWAVRDGEWKLSWVDAQAPAVAALRETEHAPLGEGLHLARLDRDPGESTNLAAEHPEVVQRLTERHQQWRIEVGLGV
ncbi:MAG TPA: sulfatase-like hydrolase/transferase [Candidatus Avipropionibacterium avicola]|uniref:Sulfatase-like hydrolase/transferase n=1 Tax=Candidatus Avipropionibacterium avicola TaxID=2840701 RepID=A0A9D1KLK5_9ACTN|nr:sulfatase-like hydrolase/transferase [Candidatus Avipropionibacterium avicola]